MSPYEPVPHVIGLKDLDDEYLYHSRQNPDPDSSDAGWSSDSDAVSFISEVGDRPDPPELASEDAAYSSKQERNAAIDAQAELLRKRYHQSTHQEPNRCGVTIANRTDSRYAIVERSPTTSFTEQNRGSQLLKRFVYSNHDCLREQYYQRYPKRSARQRTSEKPTRRVTMPRTSAQSQFPRDTGSVTDVENSDQEPFTRSTVIIPWEPHPNINRDTKGTTEYRRVMTMDQGSETAEGSHLRPTSPETLGCEYRVW